MNKNWRKTEGIPFGTWHAELKSQTTSRGRYEVDACGFEIIMLSKKRLPWLISLVFIYLLKYQGIYF